MCIAIAVHSGPMIDRETLHKCWYHNPHGAGFAFSYEGKVRVQKGFMDFDSFHDAYSSWILHEVPHLIHFRIKTTGKVDKFNTHPFRVSPNVAMIHNGTLDYYSRGNRSDTNSFVNDFLRPITRGMGEEFMMGDPGFHAGIEAVMGFSKLAFLDSLGNILILNEERGEWDKDNRIWFSNDSWRREIRPPKPKQSPNTVSPGKRGNGRFSSGPALFNRDGYTREKSAPVGEVTHVPAVFRFDENGHMYENSDLMAQGWTQWKDGSWTPPTKVYSQVMDAFRNEQLEDEDERELRELSELYGDDGYDDDGNEAIIPFDPMESDISSRMKLEFEMEADAKRMCMRDRHIIQDPRNSSGQCRADICRVLHDEGPLSWEEIEQLDDHELMSCVYAHGLMESITA